MQIKTTLQWVIDNLQQWSAISACILTYSTLVKKHVSLYLIYSIKNQKVCMNDLISKVWYHFVNLYIAYSKKNIQHCLVMDTTFEKNSGSFKSPSKFCYYCHPSGFPRNIQLQLSSVECYIIILKTEYICLKQKTSKKNTSVD